MVNIYKQKNQISQKKKGTTLVGNNVLDFRGLLHMQVIETSKIWSLNEKTIPM